MNNSPNNLKNNYDLYKFKNTFYRIIPGIIMVLMFILLLSIVGIVNPVQNEEKTSDLWWQIGAFVTSIILLVVLTKKYSKFRTENYQLVFLKFFGAYQKLEEIKISDEKTLSKAQKSIISLSDFVDTWHYEDAPNSIKETSVLISDNLRKVIVPMILSGNELQIKNFSEYFFKQCALLDNGDFSYLEWKSFGEKLNEFRIPEEKALKDKTAEEKALKDKTAEEKVVKKEGKKFLHPYVKDTLFITGFLGVGFVAWNIAKILGGTPDAQIQLGGGFFITLFAAYIFKLRKKTS